MWRAPGRVIESFRPHQACSPPAKCRETAVDLLVQHLIHQPITSEKRAAISLLVKLATAALLSIDFCDIDLNMKNRPALLPRLHRTG